MEWLCLPLVFPGACVRFLQRVRITDEQPRAVGAIIHYALPGRRVARAGRNELWPLQRVAFF